MPSGKNAWLTFLTVDLLIKSVILHALLAATMTNILLVVLAVLVQDGVPVLVGEGCLYLKCT